MADSGEEKIHAVASGDCHLSARDSTLMAGGAKGDARLAFEACVRLACRHGAPLVLPGDVLHESRTGPQPVGLLAAAARRLEAAGLECWYIEGNHDRTGDGVPWLSSVSPVFKPLGLEPAKLGELRVCGLSWRPAGELQRALAEFAERHAGDPVDVLVCHQAWTEWSGSRGQASLKEVAGAKLVFTGDLHEVRERVVRPPGRPPFTALSPGSLARTAADQHEGAWAWLWRRDAAGPKAVGVRLRSRGWRLFDLPALGGLEPFAASLDEWLAAQQARTASWPEEIRRPVARVSLGPSPEPSWAAAAARLCGERCWLSWVGVAGAAEQEGAAEPADQAVSGLHGLLQEARLDAGVDADVLELLAAGLAAPGREEAAVRGWLEGKGVPF